MKKGKDYGLLIASMVAIVAIVGLVIMFSNGTTGAAFTNPLRCGIENGMMICEDTVTGEVRPYFGSFGKWEEDKDVFLESGTGQQFGEHPQGQPYRFPYEAG